MDENVAVQISQPQVEVRNNKLTIVALVVAVIGVLAAIGTWYFTNASMTAKIDELSLKVESDNAALRQENAALKETSKALSDQLVTVKNVVLFNAIAHGIEGAAVTDDFVVARIDLAAGDDGKLGNVVIDVDNQPDMAYLYKGKGAYTLTDRELRAKCDAIIKEVSTRYGSGDAIPVWDQNTHVTVTVKNYEIGNIEGGQFKLVGETK